MRKNRSHGRSFQKLLNSGSGQPVRLDPFPNFQRAVRASQHAEGDLDVVAYAHGLLWEGPAFLAFLHGEHQRKSPPRDQARSGLQDGRLDVKKPDRPTGCRASFGGVQ